MGMHRRHFMAIARDFKEARPPLNQEQLVAVWAHCVTITANHLALQNAGFDRRKFYEASGMDSYSIGLLTGA